MKLPLKYQCLIVAIILSLTSLSHEINELTNDVRTNGEDFFFDLKGSEPNELYEIQTILAPFKNYTIQVINIPANFGFVISQVHAHIHEVTLAFTSSVDRENYSVKGTNVGLAESNSGKLGSATFELSNPNPMKVAAMLNVIGYSKTTPVPGGCNMVFNVEVAPYLQLNYTDSMIEVASQPAMSSIKSNDCNRNSLVYEIYHLYQPERDFTAASYFAFLKTMMTVDSIRANGRRVLPPLIGTNQKKRYSAYPGTGSVYAVIVSETQMGVTKSAAYVPTHTYACSTIRTSGSCNVLNTTLTKTVAATIFCIGLLLCLHGHVAPNLEMYLISSLLFGVLSAYRSHDAVSVVKPLASGLGLGLIWLLIWSCCCSSYISRFSTYVAGGGVLTSVVFFAGLADVQPLENDTNFWLLFWSLTLLIIVIFHSGHHKACILGCSIVGAYMTIIPIDHYIGSNLKYAFINIIRRATVENFDTATIDPPYQFRDMVMTALFLLLVMIGYNYQYFKLKKRPEYRQMFPHVFHGYDYFEQPYNEHMPVLPSADDPPITPGQYPWWFDATTPGSDSVFTSPHTPHHQGQAPAPQRHNLGAQLLHPEPSATLRFIPATIRGNPLLRQQPVPRQPIDQETMQNGTEPTTPNAHHVAPGVSHHGPRALVHEPPLSQPGGHVGGHPSQPQGHDQVTYPRLPIDDEAPPPSYESIQKE
nr:PREDICTED: transmembrane 7 superfamily member 3-like isoform X1 [Bemisia tabaci]